jgi:hypothetical protein
MQSSEGILNPLADLIPPHFSACSKPEPGFSTPYVVVLKNVQLFEVGDGCSLLLILVKLLTIILIFKRNHVHITVVNWLLDKMICRLEIITIRTKQIITLREHMSSSPVFWWCPFCSSFKFFVLSYYVSLRY